MGRPTTKTDLLAAAAANYEKLNTFVFGLSEKELSVHTIRGCKEYVSEIS